MRTLYITQVRFLNARATPDGRLAVAIAVQYGAGDIRVLMGLMRLEELKSELRVRYDARGYFGRSHRIPDDDVEMRFEMSGSLDAYKETTFDEYAEEAWRRDYGDRERGQELPSPTPMLEDKSDGEA